MTFMDIHTWLGEVRMVFEPDPFRVFRIYLPGTFSTGGNLPDTGGIKEKPLSAEACRHAEAVSLMIRQYFDNKKPIDPPWQWLCFREVTVLQKQVLEITSRIPFGKVFSYSRIAQAAGKPGAARFIGGTMAANPFPLIIPCHRVIKSTGAAGGFGGGTEMKLRLLEHEGWREL
ncbi:MAG: MGMT family protein [Desulfobacterales bacterium]